MVPPAVDLRRIAEWAGVTADDIQALNPELRRWTTPIRGAAYELNVPAGSAEDVRARLAAASPNELNALQWYTVKRGETLTDDRAEVARQPHRPCRSELFESGVAGAGRTQVADSANAVCGAARARRVGHCGRECRGQRCRPHGRYAADEETTRVSYPCARATRCLPSPSVTGPRSKV